MTTNPPLPEPIAAPIAPPVPGPSAPLNKYSAANDIMFEDCLKSILLKAKTGKTYSSYKTAFCPKAMQSPFGDFPADYLPKKQPAPMEYSTSLSSASSSTMKSNLVVQSITL